MSDQSSEKPATLSAAFRAEWEKRFPGLVQWPSDQAIARWQPPHKATPAWPVCVTPIHDDALTLSFKESDGTRCRILITAEGARFFRDAINKYLADYDAGQRNTSHSAISAGTSPATNPSDEQAPIAASSAADSAV